MTLEIETQRPPLHPNHEIHHPRVPSTCDRHPDHHVTGFCAACLRERLAGLETASAHRKSIAASSSSSTSALKSFFFKAGGRGGQPSSSSNNSSSLLPELRRCKSFSGSRGDGSSGPRPSAAFEPQRRSCDVRARNTLWSLFHQDGRGKVGAQDPFHPSSFSATAAAGTGELEIDYRNTAITSSSIAVPVLEVREEGELDDDDEIRPVDPVLIVDTSRYIGGRVEEAEMKTMKDHIDLESQFKKPPFKEPKEFVGTFWLAASIFSKKLQTWRRKQKLKKHSNKSASSTQQEKPPKSSRRFRETQSEIAVDAFGRRSCDIDPRFSLDAARMSFDDPRASWDAPRASWDTYMVSGRSVFPRLPPMLSVVEDIRTPAVERWDSHIPVEEDSAIPGGSAQTRDYYFDSSSRHRRSLDRSNSVRKQMVEINEPKSVSNAKVSPAGAMEFFQVHSGSKLERVQRDLCSKSLRDNCSKSSGSAYRDTRKTLPTKRSRKWSNPWKILGFIHWRSSSRGGANVAERSFSGSWPELRAQEYNGNTFQCNSNVVSSSSLHSSSGLGSMRRSHGINRREEFVMERNRSARYSPSHVDNGLLRFYLTPMRSSRRNGASGKSRHNTSNHLTRAML